MRLDDLSGPPQPHRCFFPSGSCFLKGITEGATVRVAEGLSQKVPMGEEEEGHLPSGPFFSLADLFTYLLLQEETILKLGDEINRLSAFESECSRKDTLITELQHEISAMNEKVVATLAKKDTEFHQKLASLDKDSEAKAEEIRRLKEQVGWRGDGDAAMVLLCACMHASVCSHISVQKVPWCDLLFLLLCVFLAR